MLLIFNMALDTLQLIRSGGLSILWQTMLPEGWLESLGDRRSGWPILGAKLASATK